MRHISLLEADEGLYMGPFAGYFIRVLDTPSGPVYDDNFNTSAIEFRYGPYPHGLLIPVSGWRHFGAAEVNNYASKLMLKSYIALVKLSTIKAGPYPMDRETALMNLNEYEARRNERCLPSLCADGRLGAMNQHYTRLCLTAGREWLLMRVHR